jgi:hypothetical protein
VSFVPYQMLSNCRARSSTARSSSTWSTTTSKDIAEYEKEAKSPNPPVAQYAGETLPTLRKHLELAQSLANTGTTGSR